jgi:hypothetical protein
MTLPITLDGETFAQGVRQGGMGPMTANGGTFARDADSRQGGATSLRAPTPGPSGVTTPAFPLCIPARKRLGSVGRTGAAGQRKTTPDAGRHWKVSSQVRGRFQALSRWVSPTRD